MLRGSPKLRSQGGKSMKSLTVIPNSVTALRLIGTLALLLFTPFSIPFFIVYTVCGLTDILDGALARLLRCKSDLGARLDSIADLLFYAVMIFTIMPELTRILPLGVWIIIFTTVLLRAVTYTLAAFKYHRFASLHTYMNKLTGAAVFIVPYFVRLPAALPICIAVTVVALLASVEEFLIHLTQSRYRKGLKTIFDLKRYEAVK